MRTAAAIGWFDIRHYLRSRISLFTTFVLPLILVLAIGSTVGGQPTSLSVGVLDEDGTDTSAQFAAALGDASLALATYSDADALARDIRLGMLSGAVVVQSGFSDALAAPTGQAEVRMLLPTASTDGPAVAAAISATAQEFALRPAAVRVTTAALGPQAQPPAQQIAASVAQQVPAIGTATTTVGQAADDNGFARAVTTQFVLFTFLEGMLTAMTLVEARRLGVARRMLSTPTGVGPHILGVGLGRWCLGMLQAVILFGAGARLFGARFGDPWLVTCLVVLWAALAASVGMVLGAVAKTPDQVVAMAVPLGIGLGMLGGSMWPLSVVPPFMQTLGHLTPHAWANDALDAIARGGAAAHVVADFAVLAAITSVLAGLAVILLRRSLSR